MSTTELQDIFRELTAGPFTVHVAERTPIEVSHSDFAMLKPDGGVLSVWATNGQLHHIQTSAITRISHQIPTTPAGN